MNENHLPPPEEFAVLHFTFLPSAEEGKPMQRTHSCGVFGTIEEAFTAARLLALREWQRLRSMAATGAGTMEKSGATCHVIDTEFGYDLKCDHLVVSRFWIHARPRTETGPAVS